MTVSRKIAIDGAYSKVKAILNGVVSMQSLKNLFSPKQHPLLREGKAGEEEILCEFFDSIELFYRINYPKKSNELIEEGEFVEYYRYIGYCIGDDYYFGQMLKCWGN